MQKLQNRALRKINFKKFHYPIKHIYKDHKILKFADILKVQNCLFMYQVEQNNALATSFPAHQSKDKQLPDQICNPKPVRCTFSKNK